MPAPVTYESTSRFVSTEKWRIHLNEAGTGQAIVFLHGSGPGASGWSNFQSNIGPLSEHFRVVAVDMPGWGASDSPAQPSATTSRHSSVCSTNSASTAPRSWATPWVV